MGRQFERGQLWSRVPELWFARILLSAFLLLIDCCVSCRSLPPLPPANLSEPGWQLRQGQGVWKPMSGRPELVGEIVLATNVSGDFFVQFSKTPFALATAQVMNDRWQIEFGSTGQAWRGRGEPPSRFAWFELPRALGGASPRRGWQFARTNDLWRLEQLRTGESLEGRFFP